MQWLKHAFAVDPPGPAVPNEQEAVAVEWVCRQVVQRHLTTPTLLFLEMSRPLNFVGAQSLHFFGPILSSLSNGEGCRHFATFLERRGSVDYLIGRIEALEDSCSAREEKKSLPHRDE